MTDFATQADYLEFTGASSAPTNMATLLRCASNMVRRDTITAIYDVDTGGTATDTKVVTALRDATCAQAAAWDALGINPLAGGVVQTKVVASKSLEGGGAVTYAGTNQAAAALTDAANCLVPDAWQILDDAGLLSGNILSYG